MKRTIFVVGLAVLLALTFAARALAGGWAVITLDELPGPVGVNQPLEIGFMVRQHGVTPMTDLSPVITAQLAGSMQSVRILAAPQGNVGHYVATLTLPQPGEWNWSIEAFTMHQPMPALTVLEVMTQTATAKPVSSNSLALLTGGIGLLGTVVGLVALQRKIRWAAVFVTAALLVSGVGFASVTDQPQAKPEAQVSSIATTDSQVELGHKLFIAKGCVTCHYHDDTIKDREFGVDVGPNLTNFTASPDYLKLWLKSPVEVKSSAKMPTLGLSDGEIEALIAFINEK